MHIYILTHTYMCTHKLTDRTPYMYVHIHKYIHSHTHTNTFSYIYTFLHTQYLHTYPDPCTHSHSHTFAHTTLSLRKHQIFVHSYSSGMADSSLGTPLQRSVLIIFPTPHIPESSVLQAWPASPQPFLLTVLESSQWDVFHLSLSKNKWQFNKQRLSGCFVRAASLPSSDSDGKMCPLVYHECRAQAQQGT